MNTFKDTINAVKRGPAAALLICAVVFCATFIDYNNPVYTLIFGSGSVNPGNVFHNIIYLLQFLIKPEVLLRIIIICLGASIALSVLSALLLPGYLSKVNNSLNETAKIKREYFYAIRKYFLRIFLMTLCSISLFVLFAVISVISIIPALTLTSLFISGRHNILLPAIFIDFLTIYAFLFAFTFFRGYCLFWFPSAINYNIKPFKVSKRVVDDNFWNMMGGLLIFDVVCFFYNIPFLILRILNGWTLAMSQGVALYIVNAVLDSFFVLMLVSWIFGSFKKYKQIEMSKNN